MSPIAKKNLIHSFFQSGGRKQGLANIYEQHLESQHLNDKQGWKGWATPSKIMKLHEVPRAKNEKLKVSCSMKFFFENVRWEKFQHSLDIENRGFIYV